MDILIFGCTRLTYTLVPHLTGAGHRLTVLDSDVDRLALLQRETAHPPVQVIPTVEPVMLDYLQQGGIAECQAFLALSGDDPPNLLVSQTARLIYNVSRVYCRLSDPLLREFYRGLGLEVIDAGAESLERVRQSLQSDAVRQR